MVTRPIIVGKAPAKPQTQTIPVGTLPPTPVPGRYSYVKEQEQEQEQEQARQQMMQQKQEPEDRGLDEVILAYLEENE